MFWRASKLAVRVPAAAVRSQNAIVRSQALAGFHTSSINFAGKKSDKAGALGEAVGESSADFASDPNHKVDGQKAAALEDALEEESADFASNPNLTSDNILGKTEVETRATAAAEAYEEASSDFASDPNAPSAKDLFGKVKGKFTGKFSKKSPSSAAAEALGEAVEESSSDFASDPNAPTAKDLFSKNAANAAEKTYEDSADFAAAPGSGSSSKGSGSGGNARHRIKRLEHGAQEDAAALATSISNARKQIVLKAAKKASQIVAKHAINNIEKDAKKEVAASAKRAKEAQKKVVDLKKESEEFVDDAKKLAQELLQEQKSDPDSFFNYNWGTWLENDLIEKAKRKTKFSVDGVGELLAALSDKSESNGIINDSIEQLLPGVKALAKNYSILPTGQFTARQITSVHEGLFHRIYRIDLSTGQTLILRLPYKLYADYYLERSINSEVATLDFLQTKLRLNVPKVVAYSGTSNNPLRFPFMLTEFIDGEPLVKQWNPLVRGNPGDTSVEAELRKVIDPISDFSSKLTKVTFEAYGSLYFKDDLIDGIPAFKGSKRWVIGPTTLKPYYEKFTGLSFEETEKHTGPWPLDQPTKIVSDLAKLVASSLQNKLAKYDLSHDVPNKVVDAAGSALKVYQQLLASSDSLLNTKNSSIPNLDELIKPRLFIPDLDPVNVLVKEDGTPWFVDLEDTTITPYILNPFPKFVEYDGPKVYDTSDIPDFDELQDHLKDQYEYMQQRTRNQSLWERDLAQKLGVLASAAAPVVKKLREAFTAALKDRLGDDYLNVEKALVQLQNQWSDLKEHRIVEDVDCPIEFTQKDVDQFEKEFNEFQDQLANTPFAATKGWVPQDLFESLQKEGIIVKEGDNYKIDTQKVLKDLEEM